jgi:F-type H+-transporting ATPase subunit gamma
MASTKEISRRIKSVSSTKKITKAMEMVAAAKMRKAIEAVLKTRTYANLSWELILRLAQHSENNSEISHELLTSRKDIKKIAIVLITSNRGMCGAYNAAIINKTKESINKHTVETEFILVGKKGSALYNQDYKIAAEFDKSDLLNNSKEIFPIINLVIADYLSGKYDKVLVAYTDFINPAKQIPRIKQLLPLEFNETDAYLGLVGQDPKVGVTPDLIQAKSEKHLHGNDYTFEPNPVEVLNVLIPRLLEIQLLQAFLEANASEHSSRMTAMHQATEAASDMEHELTLFYNKARQASITSEIAEISAGANALAE